MSYLNQFHHKIVGKENGTKLVFLHGLMGYAGNWLRITPSFEKTFRILTYDQRGHGRSLKPSLGYRPEDYADDLRKILDELGWEKIFLVGHSMGGRNALNFASRFPSRIEKLVIEDIGPDANAKAAQHIHDLLGKIPTPFHDKRKAKDFLMNELGDTTLGAYLYSNLIEVSPGVWDWRFSKSAILESVDEGRARERWDEVRALKCPALVLRGERSQEFPLEVFERMQKENSLITGHEIKNSSHWIHFDQPEEFIRQLQKFFASLP